jgi:DNA-binding HxlR family transcriptional regulator
MKKECPVYRITEFLGKRWSLLLLLELYRKESGWKRYSEIRRNLPYITSKMLSSRLKELEEEDLIDKRIDAKTYPVKTEYRLTKSGLDFLRIIREMRQWSLRWDIKNPICKEKDCRECDLA